MTPHDIVRTHEIYTGDFAARGSDLDGTYLIGESAVRSVDLDRRRFDRRERLSSANDEPSWITMSLNRDGRVAFWRECLNAHAFDENIWRMNVAKPNPASRL